MTTRESNMLTTAVVILLYLAILGALFGFGGIGVAAVLGGG